MAISASEQLAIEFHLREVMRVDNSRKDRRFVYSCFTAALRDARRATGRDLASGTLTDPAIPNWLGTIGYLILFDHLGECLSPYRTRTRPQGSPFERFCVHFTKLDRGKILALYALRCSFAHQYSLINIPPPQRSAARRVELTHAFQTASVDSPNIVRLPSKPWSGRFAHLREEQRTWVNLEAIGSFAEEVFANVRERAADGNVRIAFNGPPARRIRELQLRYTLTAPVIISVAKP